MDDNVRWISHILGDPFDGHQHCILCGVTVKPHMLGALPAGKVYEYAGCLKLIEPDDAEICSCQEAAVYGDTDASTHA